MEDKSGEKNNFAPERRVKEQLIRETEYIEPPSVASVAAPAPAPAPVVDREEKERALIASLPRDGNSQVFVRRLPDPLLPGLSFACPCAVESVLPAFALTTHHTDKESIECAVQQLYNGGYYRLQLRVKGAVKLQWTTTILDAQQPAPSPSV